MEGKLINKIEEFEDEICISLIVKNEFIKKIINVFEALKNNSINVDIVNYFLGDKEKSNIIISTNIANKNLIKEVLNFGFFELKIDEDVSKIVISGIGIKTNLSVIYGIIQKLYENNIEIITLSTSETKITMLVKKEKSKNALNFLKEFLK